MADPTTYHIALGSNLGDRVEHLRGAVHAIDADPSCQVVAVSSVWETEAHVRPGDPSQPAFLNAVLACTSSLGPEELIQLLFAIETQHGRDRSTKGLWKPRPLDLDIILAADQVVQTDLLSIPHPRLDQRRFVLAPLAEIAEEDVVPAPFDKRVGYLLSTCPDTTDITRTSHSLQLDPSA